MAVAHTTPTRGGTKPLRRGATPSRRSAIAGLAFVLPAAALLCIFFGAPLVLSLVMSFFDWPLFGERAPVGLDNYTAILSDDIAMRSIGFTLYYTLLVTVITLVVSFFLAIMVQRGGRAVGFFRTAIFIPSAVGFGLAGLLWGFLYNAQIGVFSGLLRAVGLADEPVLFFQSQTSALWAVIAMVVWKSLGLNTLVMLVGLQSIPAELHEAATVDGATWWQRTRLITLPLMRPTFALLLVLGISGALLSFDQFFVLTAGGPDRSTITVVYAIYRAAFTQFRLGYAAAIGVVLMLILVLVNLVQLRFLRSED